MNHMIADNTSRKQVLFLTFNLCWLWFELSYTRSVTNFWTWKDMNFQSFHLIPTFFFSLHFSPTLFCPNSPKASSGDKHSPDKTIRHFGSGKTTLAMMISVIIVRFLISSRLTLSTLHSIRIRSIRMRTFLNRFGIVTELENSRDFIAIRTLISK